MAKIFAKCAYCGLPIELLTTPDPPTKYIILMQAGDGYPYRTIELCPKCKIMLSEHISKFFEEEPYL